jgi:hypothetical protein
MTPKQSLTRKQSLIRRSLAVLSAVLLATAWAVGISTPASAAAPRALEIVSVTTSNEERCPSADMCAILKDERFAVQVRVVDRNGDPTTVSRDTTIVLEKLSGEGSLVPDGSEVTILRGGSEATFAGTPPDGLTYTQSANPTLRVRVTSGVQLNSDQITVHIAVTAVGRMAPQNGTVDLDDPNCGDGNGVPNSVEPTCGHLLTEGATGAVVMSVGSCEGLGPNNTNPCRTVGDTTALLVTLYANIEHSQDNPHSTMILACDKDLCGQTGVPKLPVFVTLQNTGPLNDEAAPACQRKGVLDDGLKACVDYVSSMRSDGDLYLFVLFNLDLRAHG